MFHTVNPWSFICTNSVEIKRKLWAFQQMLFVCQMTVCQRKCETVDKTFFLPFFFYLQGAVISRFISPCLKICPRFFLSYWRSLSHDQSANCKGQSCDFCILLPIPPPSTNLILTQKDNTNSFPQISACMCKQAYPSYAVRRQGIWFKSCFFFFFLWSAHSDHSLQNTFEIYSRDSWRTRHICSLAIDIFSKQQSVEQQWCAPFPRQNPHPSWGQASKVYFHTTS